MNRREFTYKISQLLLEMYAAGEEPVGQEWFRTAEQQFMHFMKGRFKLAGGQIVVNRIQDVVTYKDGYDKISAHQRGKALDIYFCSRNGDDVFVDYEHSWTDDRSKRWHDRWVEMGGLPVIETAEFKDRPHFEG